MLTIKFPIWKTTSFGVADFRLEGAGEILVKCSYRDRDNNLLYPHTYIMDKEKARTYPPVKMGSHHGREIPIADFEILEDKE